MKRQQQIESSGRAIRFGGRWLGHAILAALALSATVPANARQADPPAQALAPVTVTATRSAQSPFDVAASVDVVSMPASGSLDVNVSEFLNGVPGILARDRQNYAQGEQISIRGFGARATFGIRGVRLYTDGIPATMPDGQGQVSHFSLDSADRIEVLRGPFSALYGNSAGGVVQLFTADGSDPAQVRLGVAGGSDGLLRTAVNARGTGGAFDYNVDFMHFRSDGYRDHSQAQRESGQAKVGWQLNQQSQLTVVVNTLNAPDAQDPGGLTPAQYRANPRQSVAAATRFHARKSVSQSQGGLIYDVQLDDANQVRVMTYYGQRRVRQFLPIPVSSQANPLHSGGVIDLDNAYGGVDARWSWSSVLAGHRVELTCGVAYDAQRQDRRGYENFVGEQLGVQGGLRRDEANRIHDFDQYAQARWRITEAWTLMAGFRHSQVKFATADNYITTANPDDSGRVDYAATTPVAGVLYRVSAKVHVYAAYGMGFETPTFAELSYRHDGGTGLNFGLRAAHTRSSEIGLKLQPRPGTHANFALFRADSRNELAIASNLGGRTTYQNIDRARRQGVEASLSQAFGARWTWQLAYTYLDATFRSPFLACSGYGCASPTTPVAAGARIAGVPRSNAYAALHYGGERGWQADADVHYIGAVPTNDLGSESAPASTRFGAGVGYVLAGSHWRTHAFLRIDNVLARRYVSAVIVNDGNGRYFEPGPGRSLLLGVDLRWEP